MIPSENELTLLRTRPQSTKLWMSVYKPPTVLACQVATSHGQSAYQIDYDTVSEGSYTAIESGMTMYIGSSPGASDVGKIRVRSADASQITVAENDDINWTDGQYLTIVRFWEINAVFPRIIQDPADETNTIWYKDYDIAYVNQNDNLGSTICMGSHYAGFLATGSHGVYYSASGTSSLEGDSLTYSWWFQGATVTGSSANTPGFIQYDTPGHYTTRLTVTTPTGTADISYRHVSIYDRPELGTNNPILRWEIKSLSGSRDSGGYTARFVVHESFSNIVDGALVVIFADDWYGDTEQSIGNGLNRGSIVFIGYILDGSITVNYQTSSLEFRVGSPSEVMKQVETFAVGVNSSASPIDEPSINENIPSSWAVVKDMDCRRAIYHYLRWHSTVLMTTDYEFSGTDREIQYFDADRESLFSAIKTLMDGTLHGNFVSSRDGKLWAEVSAAATNNAASNFPVNMSLERFDWMGNVRIREETTKSVSFLEMGGIYYPGPGFESTPLLASAPGDTPSYRGTAQKLSGMALASQAQLNTLVGNVFAWKNARYPSVKLNLSGHYRNLDIAPIEIVKMTMNAEDNIKGLSWTNKDFVINSMDFSYSPKSEKFLPTVDLHEVTQGMDGATISIPEVPPTTGISGGFNIPQFQIPAIPSFPINIQLDGGNFPIFIPIQAVHEVGAVNDGIPMDVNSVSAGPAVGQTGVGGGSDMIVVGGFVVPSTYVGTLTIYTCWNVTSSGGVGDVDIEVSFDAIPLVSGVWDDSEATNVYGDYTATTLTGYTPQDITPDWEEDLAVSPLDFVSLWTRYNSSTSTFDKTLQLIGWYIVYG